MSVNQGAMPFRPGYLYVRRRRTLVWPLLKLKIDEVSYFASQLDAHARHPSLYLFYLSAFLSSARSVTFHVQKHAGENGSTIYRDLRDQILSDPVCKFFVEMRNQSEKEGYPQLHVSAQVASTSESDGKVIWTSHASLSLFGPDDALGLRYIQNYLHDEWDFTSHSGPPGRLRLRYKFPNYPEKSKDVTQACQDFAARLWQFVAIFRWRWEQENEPDARSKKFSKWLEPGYEFPDPWADKK